MTKTTNARYVSATGSTLAIRLRASSTGFIVSATLRTPGEKTQTGCRSTHDAEAEARTAFDTLKTNALARGWTEHTRKDRASAFTEIPAPPPAKKGARA